jgi:hypothetical protein
VLPDAPTDTAHQTSSPRPASPVQGLFLSHIRSARIDRHFDRLVRQTEGLVEWHPAHDSADQHMRSADSMPHRHARMIRNGGVQGGYMDVVIVPRALDLHAPFVWAVEYDVDYSGDWRDFFSQFRDCQADLLTSTIVSAREDPDWRYWRTGRSPYALPPCDGHRAFHPVMRLSRRFLDAYATSLGTPGWEGHYEYTLPTFAIAEGFTIEDIGGALSYCPPDRQGRNYCNTPTDRSLSPGTFVWRPSLPFYFHEKPEIFERPDMLHHPVKPAVSNWEAARPWRRWRRAVLSTGLVSMTAHACTRLWRAVRP